MIHEWWADQPDQRFWMETIRRRDYGVELLAPHRKANGARHPYYELLSYTRPGDVILHWDTRAPGGSAFVGWSVVDGPARDSDEIVYADGTPTPGRTVPLRSFTPFESPLDLVTLTTRVTSLRAVRKQTEDEHPGLIYFPFDFHADGTMRAHEGGYLTKFPVALFAELPELASARTRSAEHIGIDTARAAGRGESQDERRQARESGRIADAQVRRAIEMRAVGIATQHYQAKYVVEDVGASEPFDLRLTHRGSGAIRHVEVKGSTGDAATVELTHGEVNQARNFQPTDLFVVGGIRWRREGDEVIAWDGEARMCSGWVPDEASLLAVRFRHDVPTAIAVAMPEA